MHHAPPRDEAARRFMGNVKYKLLRKHRADRVPFSDIFLVEFCVTIYTNHAKLHFYHELRVLYYLTIYKL